MTKEDYIEICNKEFTGNARELIIEQINNFYNLQNKQLKHHKYNIGDDVKLSKDMFLHGFRDINILELVKNQGLICRDFGTGEKGLKIKYCVCLWHIKKCIYLKDYLLKYSGMEVKLRYDLEGKDYDILVPYGKFDEFMQKLRKVQYCYISATLPMETSFIPNLAKNNDNVQIAFIINGSSKYCKILIRNNILNEEIDINTVYDFINRKSSKLIETFKTNRQQGNYERIAYILFGLPQNMIEGILVGEKYEKDKKLLQRIKLAFPNAYICNIQGKVVKQ